jgi:hypothetical protein
LVGENFSLQSLSAGVAALFTAALQMPAGPPSHKSVRWSKMKMIESEHNGAIGYAEIDALADRGDRLFVAYKNTTPKNSDAEEIAELKRLEREEAAFIKALHDPSRQRHALYTYGSNLIELLSEMVNDAVDQKKRDVARKLEAAISELHDVTDAAEDALDELGK